MAHMRDTGSRTATSSGGSTVGRATFNIRQMKKITARADRIAIIVVMRNLYSNKESTN